MRKAEEEEEEETVFLLLSRAGQTDKHGPLFPQCKRMLTRAFQTQNVIRCVIDGFSMRRKGKRGRERPLQLVSLTFFSCLSNATRAQFQLFSLPFSFFFLFAQSIVFNSPISRSKIPTTTGHFLVIIII